MAYNTVYHLSWRTPRETVRNPRCPHEAPESGGGRFCQQCGLRREVPADEHVRSVVMIRQHCALGPNGDLGEISWYDHEEDLAEISRECPGVLFRLSGRGSDEEDLWDLFALDGKIQKHRAQIIRKETPDPDAWSCPGGKIAGKDDGYISVCYTSVCRDCGRSEHAMTHDPQHGHAFRPRGGQHVG